VARPGDGPFVSNSGTHLAPRPPQGESPASGPFRRRRARRDVDTRARFSPPFPPTVPTHRPDPPFPVGAVTAAIARRRRRAGRRLRRSPGLTWEPDQRLTAGPRPQLPQPGRQGRCCRDRCCRGRRRRGRRRLGRQPGWGSYGRRRPAPPPGRSAFAQVAGFHLGARPAVDGRAAAAIAPTGPPGPPGPVLPGPGCRGRCCRGRCCRGRCCRGRCCRGRLGRAAGAGPPGRESGARPQVSGLRLRGRVW
jgi:hypothetical protein